MSLRPRLLLDADKGHPLPFRSQRPAFSRPGRPACQRLSVGELGSGAAR